MVWIGLEYEQLYQFNVLLSDVLFIIIHWRPDNDFSRWNQFQWRISINICYRLHDFVNNQILLPNIGYSLSFQVVGGFCQ